MPSLSGPLRIGVVAPDRVLSMGQIELSCVFMLVCIPQSSSITGTSPSDCFVSYAGHALGRSYPSAEKQSVYSTAPVYWES